MPERTGATLDLQDGRVREGRYYRVSWLWSDASRDPTATAYQAGAVVARAAQLRSETYTQTQARTPRGNFIAGAIFTPGKAWLARGGLVAELVGGMRHDARPIPIEAIRVTDFGPVPPPPSVLETVQLGLGRAVLDTERQVGAAVQAAAESAGDAAGALLEDIKTPLFLVGAILVAAIILRN